MKNLFVLVFISLITISLEAQSFNEILKVVASDRGNGHFFGFSVDVDSNYAVIGAINAGTPNNLFGQQGSAYIFKRSNNNNWQEVKKVVASDGFDMDNFGYSVDISGDYVIVGAYQEDEDTNNANTLSAAGAAFIFKKDEGGVDNWGEVKKLIASDRDQDDNFGRSVGISGSYAVVGANYEQHDINGMNSMFNAGSAYIFEKDAGGTDNWGELKKLVATDRTSNDDFGRSVSIDGDFIVIGAQKQNLDGSSNNYLINAGAVYVFEKNTGGSNNWGELQKIVAIDRIAGVRFGSAVAIDGDYIVVGASSATSTPNVFSGAAYVFKKDLVLGTPNWSEFKKLVASDAAANDEFGAAVDISGDNIIVGAARESEDLNGSNTLNQAGAAYIFNKDEGGVDNWGETQKIIANDRAMTARFGTDVAIKGDFAMVGARVESKDATGGNSIGGAGAAYVFEFGIVSSTHLTIDDSNLKIYPNPVQNILNISSDEAFQFATIYNVLGQSIQQISIQNNQAEINVSTLPKGSYILQLVNEKGQTISRQFIKH